jgi:hypothetical protein
MGGPTAVTSPNSDRSMDEFVIPPRRGDKRADRRATREMEAQYDSSESEDQLRESHGTTEPRTRGKEVFPYGGDLHATVAVPMKEQ